jgi:hypothetical protein
MNQLNPLDQTKKKKKTGPKYQNFIEAFKDIGSSIGKAVTQDVVKGTAQNVVDVFTKGQAQPDTPAPQEDFKFEDYLNQQERKIRAQERTRFETIRREEKIIYSREQQQVKIQIETLQTQIKELAKEQTGLMKEVEQASFQAVINPGVYHQNFFERLLHLIKIAKKKVAESRTWLHLHNHRAQKRGYYWQNVKKSGTKFMLSHERYMATQAG